MVRNCNIDAEVLVQTRNKYAHLGLDSLDRGKGSHRAWNYSVSLRKVKVLLSCCLLDELGLTMDEINMCCNRSIMKDVAEDIARAGKSKVKV